ncbi:MAG: TPR end-of-group domain-containing protein [Planctomycetota bacterium]
MLRNALITLVALPCIAGFGRAAPQRPDASPSLRERILRLSSDDETADAELEALASLAEEASLAALDGLSSEAPLGRRRRAHLVFRAGGERSIGPALAALADPDPGTRAELVAFLGRGDLGASALAERVAALSRLALADPEMSLRADSIERLASFERPESAAALDAILDELESPLRGFAAALLADRPSARGIVGRRARAGAASDPEILGPMLAAYGRSLAERRDRSGAAELLAGRRHPDPIVRRGARLGLDAYLARLITGGDALRASAAVEELESMGLDPAEGALLRGRLALMLGVDPLAASRAVGVILHETATSTDREARSLRATALAIDAAARIAASSTPEPAREARAPLAEAERLFDGLLAERLDRTNARLAREHAAWLHRRAQCELLEIVRTLAESPGEDPLGAQTPELIARLVESGRRVHSLELEAQLALALAGASGTASLDALLEDELSPSPLFLENPRSTAWPSPRALSVRAALGRILASVARDEMPGFEPLPGVAAETADPLRDPERADRLRRILSARLDETSRSFLDLRERLRREMAGNPAAPSADDAERIQVLNREWLDLLDASQREGKGEARAALESRAPSMHGMMLVRALREEGLPARARALALAVKSDLEKSGDLKRYWLIEADIELAIGSTWGDEDDPARAEIEITRAVERLETIETALKERGASLRDLATVRGLRSSALVALAVNANVKMRNPERALAYFERAFELRQDEFMRVLRACYSARSGRGEEARTILRELTPSPANLYNVACTWALLGEAELALDCLRRNLELNPMSAGARRKQNEWARRDPDLESLREDPRFLEIVGE